MVNLELGAKLAMSYMDVITTSNTGTGQSMEIEKIQSIKDTIGDFPLAIASEIIPENLTNYLSFADCFLVVTGISKSCTRLDEEKL